MESTDILTVDQEDIRYALMWAFDDLMEERMSITERDVQIILAARQSFSSRYEVMVPNCFITHDNEADLFAIRRSGYCDEFEIKLTKQDFLADAKKMIRYRDLSLSEVVHPHPYRYQQPNYKPKHKALLDGDLPTNYFWYVFPKGMVEVDEIPDFCGILEVVNGVEVRTIREPALLHKGKMTVEDRYRNARKNSHRMWRLLAQKRSN